MNELTTEKLKRVPNSGRGTLKAFEFRSQGSLY